MTGAKWFLDAPFTIFVSHMSPWHFPNELRIAGQYRGDLRI
jgi:hypothetical protein